MPTLCCVLFAVENGNIQGMGQRLSAFTLCGVFEFMRCVWHYKVFVVCLTLRGVFHMMWCTWHFVVHL